MPARLILIEGLPGTGKTSTAQWLDLALRDAGVPGRMFLEGDKAHPVHVWDLPDLADPPRFARRFSANWRRFVSESERSGETRVLESTFLMSNVRLLHFCACDEAFILEHLLSLEAAASGLRPALVHLRVPRVAGHIETVCSQRGARWGARVLEMISRTPYGRARGVRCMQGMIAFWQDYQDLCDRLCRRLAMPVLTIEDPAGCWEETRGRIAADAGLSVPAPCAAGPAQEETFRGAYLGAASARVVTVEPDGKGNLLLQGYLWPRMRLVRISDRRFYLEGFPFEIEFEAGGGSPAALMRITRRGGQDGTPQLYERIPVPRG